MVGFRSHVGLLTLCTLVFACSTDDTGSNEQTTDCRYTASSCALGFTCIQQAGVWQCVDEATAQTDMRTDSGLQTDVGSDAPEDAPRLSVVEPQPNDVADELLQIRLELVNFQLIDPDVDSDGSPDRENVQGEGHLYVTIDDNPVAPWVFETAFAVRLNTLEDRSSGHVLRVEVRNNDQSAHNTLLPVEVPFSKSTDPVQGQAYHYVLIEDRTSNMRNDEAGGADIAGVELVKSGSSFFASQVHWCEFGNFDNSDADDCNQALGAPADGEGDCIPNPGPTEVDYVSLGGVGGQMILSFGNLEEIVQGAQIFVYECGTAQNSGAVEEPFDLRVGVATQPSDPNWLPCISNGSGIVSCNVPALP